MVVTSCVSTGAGSLPSLSNPQCSEGAYLQGKAFLVYHWVCAKRLVSIFKAFHINFKAEALPVGRDGLSTRGSAARHLLTPSFLLPGPSPRGLLPFLPGRGASLRSQEEALEKSQILEREAGAAASERRLKSYTTPQSSAVRKRGFTERAALHHRSRS